MKYYPNEYDKEELRKLNVEPWMVELLKLNPGYLSWGPYEDYMADKESQWGSRVVYESWQDFGPWKLDDLNEVVNFYFYLERDSTECLQCDGSGYNYKTNKLRDDWYSFNTTEWIYSSDRKRRYNNFR